MTEKREKHVTMLSPPGKRRVAAITSENGVTIGVVEKKEPGSPVQPGETLLAVERVAGDGPERYRITDEYGHEGPSRSATPAYRKGWSNVFGKRRSSGKELN